MSRWKQVLLGLAIALAVACMHRPRTDPDTWQLRGAVVGVSDARFQVRHKTGHVVDLVIDDWTVFEQNRQTVSRQALHPGVRVTVDVEVHQSGVSVARRVQVF